MPMILEGSNFMCLLHSNRPNISTPQYFPWGFLGACGGKDCKPAANSLMHATG